MYEREKRSLISSVDMALVSVYVTSAIAAVILVSIKLYYLSVKDG